MSEQLDRPVRPVRGPRPAADAGVDPIDYRSTAEPEPETKPETNTPGPAEIAAERVVAATVVQPHAQSPASVSTTGAPLMGPAAREQTVQLNSRIGVDVAAAFDAAAARFPTKRAALEHAIIVAFGS